MQLALTLAAVAPLALLSLLHARTYARSVEDDRAERLGEVARAIGLQLGDTIDAHRRGLVALGRTLEQQDDVSERRLRPAMLATAQLYSGFRSLLVADDRAEVISFHWAIDPPGFLHTGGNIADRPYYQAAARGEPWFISDAFLGRGPREDPIVAISTPFLSPAGKRMVLQGALNLDRFVALEQRYQQLEEVRLLLLDARQKVIYASPGWGLAQLQALSGSPLLVAALGAGQRAFRFDADGGAFAVGQARSRQGWSVLVAQPERVIRQGAVRYYWFTALVTVVALLLVVPLARTLAARITVPLERLAGSLRSFLRTGQADKVDEPRRAPREVQALVRDLGQVTERLGKVLGGLLPICAACKRIRDDRGEWNQLETYVHGRTEAEFSHETCPDCSHAGRRAG